ncbi:glycosyltransferase family 2 protein [Methanobrevibacter sp.]|uniref:glycosyltransferase family 2 protein n=1 Tax=Methanobrevibacter sp. TaxID=66852 RepID=UPI00388E5254
MSKPKISIILPVYNVEDYLSETLDSILGQSMIDEIEVIMVDDGSTDESRYIIERYALDHDNFHAYHKENEGQGIARNYALGLANGDYIHFLDSDDYLPPDAYETLYGIASKNDSDFAIGNVLRFARYNEWDDILFKNSYGDITEVIDSTSLDQMPSLIWDTITCNKLYKREFLLENNIRFPDKKISFEDIPFSLESYILSDNISITPEVWYYWRLRSNRTSTTQQDLDVSNIRDRLEILRAINEMLISYDVNQDIVNEEYSKWLDHDLKFFIKRFDHFPKKYHKELFEEIYDLVKLMPTEIIEDLNTYKKAIFKMVLNRDFESFIRFAPMENELFENPHIPDFIDDEYKGYFDFKRSVKDEELIAELADIESDESNIYLEFSGKINYLSDDYKYEVSADLMENGSRCPLEVDGSRIVIPFDVIKDKNHTNIEVRYKFNDFTKECLLKNRHRQSIEFEDFYLDLDMGINSHLFIDIRHKADNEIEITDITYDDGDFILRGTSGDRVSQVHVENVISFNRISCPVEYQDQLTFRISGSDLSNAAVKKWEINCSECPNSIRLSRSFEFFRSHDKTRFINSRNKILIEHDVYNPFEILNEFNDQAKEWKSEISSLKGEKSKLTWENDKLKRENAELNGRISEFKSRKVVKIADKLKLN